MDQLTRDPRLTGTSIADSVLHLIGNTPLVALPRLAEKHRILGLLTLKQEAANPGGSAKDRPALRMILDAEQSGQLRPGGTIVEPTSGNTGVGLAIVAAQRGYRCILVTTDKVAPEKIALLRAHGADVVICPAAVEPDDPRSYYRTAERLQQQHDAYRPDQYTNPSNPAAHQQSTGPEIWQQTDGRITHLVAGAGTSGTVTGIARYLKAQNPNIVIVVADPHRSLYSGGDGRPYLVEGVGEDFIPAAWDPALYDRILPITDRDSFAAARDITRTEGILVGGSGGTAIAAGLTVAREAGPDALTVILNPDTGRGYLSRVHDDHWMARNGFLDAEHGPYVRDAIRLSGRQPGQLHPGARARYAISLLRDHELPAMPVTTGPHPYTTSEIVGTIELETLLSAATADPAALDLRIDALMGRPAATVGIGENAADARKTLQQQGQRIAVVLDGGYSSHVIDRADLHPAA